MERVLPRDAFNDANLLKCIGQLTLLIEDGKVNLAYEYDGQPFDIVQDRADGSTFVRNVEFYTKDGTYLRHRRGLNARSAWPLYLYAPDEDGDDIEHLAFDEQGKFLPSF